MRELVRASYQFSVVNVISYSEHHPELTIQHGTQMGAASP